MAGGGSELCWGRGRSTASGVAVRSPGGGLGGGKGRSWAAGVLAGIGVGVKGTGLEDLRIGGLGWRDLGAVRGICGVGEAGLSRALGARGSEKLGWDSGRLRSLGGDVGLGVDENLGHWDGSKGYLEVWGRHLEWFRGWGVRESSSEVRGLSL